MPAKQVARASITSFSEDEQDVPIAEKRSARSTGKSIKDTGKSMIFFISVDFSFLLFIDFPHFYLLLHLLAFQFSVSALYS